MPGKRISELTALSGAASANNDDLLIFDSGAGETKRISRSQLAEGMVPDLPLQYYLGVLNANPTQRLNGDALQIGDFYLDAVTKYTVVYNGSGWNSYASVIAAQAAAEAARDAAQLAETNAEAAQAGSEAARDAAVAAAEAARDQAEDSEVAKAAAQLARDQARAARDAATVNAAVYASPAAAQIDTGLAVGEQYQVVSGDEIIRYRKDSTSASTEVARYPTAAAVNVMSYRADSTEQWYFGAKQVVSGIEDGRGQIVSAVYMDGSQDNFFSVFTVDADEQWYAGYEQVWHGVAAPDGGIVSADLLGGGSFETFMASADPMGNADAIVIIGDSLTQNSTYAAALATDTGRQIINLGRGSQQIKHIAARMGAISVTMTVSGGQIVSGSNTITHINGQVIAGGLGNQITGNQLLSRADSNTTDSVRGTLGSVVGTLTRTAAGGPPSTTETYTFVPDAGQTLPAKCPAGTPWVTDYSAYRDLTHVIWAGSNDIGWGDDLARVQAVLPAMVDSLGHGRVIVMNPINRTGQAAYQEGGAWWLTTFAIEQYIANLMREKFVNIRRLMIDQGLFRAGITASGTDSTDIAADTIATSLKSDPIHHNTAGNQVIAEIVAEQINARRI